jgi:hypothetical protein
MLWPTGVACREAEDVDAQRSSAILRNVQWQVTMFGMISRSPYRLQIDADRLLATDTYDGIELYDWPLHVITWRWVKPDLFFEAFEAAIDIYQGRYPGNVNWDLLRTSFDQTRRYSTPRTR